MQLKQPTSPYAGMDMVRRALGSALTPGEVGVVMARAGVGKTACLTHIALEHLLEGGSVLHVCIDEIPDKIKVWYQEFVKNLHPARQGEPASQLLHEIEPHRFILAYLNRTFSPEKLEQSLGNLKEQANFSPSLVVVDGLDFDHAPRSLIEDLRTFAARHELAMWMSARTHRHMSEANERGIPYPCYETDDLFHTILLLEQAPDAIQVKVLKAANRYRPECPAVWLNSQTYLVMEG